MMEFKKTSVQNYQMNTIFEEVQKTRSKTCLLECTLSISCSVCGSKNRSQPHITMQSTDASTTPTEYRQHLPFTRQFSLGNEPFPALIMMTFKLSQSSKRAR